MHQIVSLPLQKGVLVNIILYSKRHKGDGKFSNIFKLSYGVAWAKLKIESRCHFWRERALLGIETRALCTLGMCSTIELHTQPSQCKDFNLWVNNINSTEIQTIAFLTSLCSFTSLFFKTHFPDQFEKCVLLICYQNYHFVLTSILCQS